MNKPEWYSKVVNPFTGKVPSIAYGGPPVAPDQPSSESAKIPESLSVQSSGERAVMLTDA
jgi:glutathione S-transferase